MEERKFSSLPNTVTRRRLLALGGGAVLALVAAACSGGSSSEGARAARRGTKTIPTTGGAAASGSTATTVPNASAASCVLSPEMTEGPFYLTGEPERRDVTEGKAGTPLQLQLTVVDADRCTPIPGAVVEIWHADAEGAYSGFGAGASSRTFLRGSQIADHAGNVVFDTIYPGWYQGRATHIHLKARTSKTASQVHTTQLFFDDALTDTVMTASSYGGRAGPRTRNAQDSIYRSGGAQSTLAVDKRGDGYTGTLVMGIRSTL